MKVEDLTLKRYKIIKNYIPQSIFGMAYDFKEFIIKHSKGRDVEASLPICYGFNLVGPYGEHMTNHATIRYEQSTISCYHKGTETNCYLTIKTADVNYKLSLGPIKTEANSIPMEIDPKSLEKGIL